VNAESSRESALSTGYNIGILIFELSLNVNENGFY